MESDLSSSSTGKSDGGGSGGGGVSKGTQGEEEEEEEESSYDHNFETELENFRRLWQNEIKVSPAKEKPVKSQSKGVSEELHEVPPKIDEARSLFMCGVQAEKAGLLEKAISYYRRAVQLVPDIEFRINESFSDHSSDSFEDDSDSSSDKENLPNDECDEKDINLVEKFQKLAAPTGITCICQPKFEQKGSHISILPPEIFMYILKWVVSSDLDLLSIEQISKVCRGFYICARDSEIWRLVCLRIWDVNIGSPNKYGSWRNMFIQRPHLSFCGVYISKTTYVRYGEPSFQDTNYRPCYLVEYFRYLRFFPEGLVLMLTTPDDPYQSLFKLRYRKSKHQNVLYGRYKLVGNTVMAVVKKPKSDTVTPGGLHYYRFKRQRQVNLQEACDQTFHLELELRNVKRRYNCQLVWKRYSIHMVYRNGQETVSDFDLAPSNFPPFWFSRVKSFTAESESPLK